MPPAVPCLLAVRIVEGFWVEGDGDAGAAGTHALGQVRIDFLVHIGYGVFSGGDLPK